MMMHAVWLCAYGYVSTGLGIIASLRHQIGTAYGVAHGIASTIVFPFCIDFNRPIIDDLVVREIPKTVSDKALDRVLREAFSPDAPGVFRLA